MKIDIKNIIFLVLVLLSLFLLVYSSLYIINYYFDNDLLFHYPENKNFYTKNKLNPNEIGDSIGGILSPIIGITGAVLTFLAFYVQHQANQEQSSHLAYEKEQRLSDNEKNKINEIKKDISNVQMFISYLEILVEHYEKSGKKVESYLSEMNNFPLSTFYYNYNYSGINKYFAKIDFQSVFSSILGIYEQFYGSWESKFVKTISYIDYYEFSLEKIKTDSSSYINSKNEQLKDILDEIRKVVINENNFPVIKDAVDNLEYWKIIKDLNFENGAISVNRKSVANHNLDLLYISFFPGLFSDPKFINNIYPFSSELSRIYNELEFVREEFLNNNRKIERHYRKYYLDFGPLNEIKKFVADLKSVVEHHSKIIDGKPNRNKSNMFYSHNYIL